jgi:hypothetical protein
MRGNGNIVSAGDKRVIEKWIAVPRKKTLSGKRAMDGGFDPGSG